MRLHPVSTPLVLAIALGGCAVGPNYVRPQLDAPKTFVGSADIVARQGVQPVDLTRWWDGFHDPLLTSLVDEAERNNLDVAQALARVGQAKAGLNAATATLLPSGGVQSDVTRTRNSDDVPLGAVGRELGFARDYTTYEGDLTASWEIDVFGGSRRGQQAAAASYQASSAGAVAARLAVAAQVADTYVLIRGLQQRLAIAREQVDTQRKLVDTVRLQYSKGIAADLQVHQAEGALAQVKSTIPVLEQGLIDAMNALDVLLGAQPGTIRTRLVAVQPIPVAPSIADAGGPADLLRRRPDIIIAERRLAATNAQIGQAMAEYYPKISLSGALGTATSIGSGSLFSANATQAQGTAGLRWRLFDFGRINAEIKAARGANAEALASYRQTVLRASEDVEDAFTALVKRDSQQQVLADGAQSLARARDQSEIAYKGGIVSLIEVLDADSRLLQTRDAQAQAQTEVARAAISSFRALGGGWNPPAQLAQK
ncbi:efflux transporter outer membrane subunit [Novosphingobium sp. FSW06-99]|uniref:efflux transporter outer membrane subunit n=1 Tax=Novosphingobium sp. FSW06-99 TaxID=1739113 RepID=UPI00076D36A4|nr:efflux transporter outer membrane subunit [Novosphingobium sp. FSW06-99]KUR74821.1 RND transporter [Novosphingobium sp. FSW06-99]